MKNVNLVVGEQEIKIIYDTNTKSVNVNGLYFKDVTDFTYFVNKLTDICEELIQE